VIYIAGISIALFNSALLLNKKSKSKSDVILFLWMVLIAIHLGLFYINFSEELYTIPYLLGIELPLPFLHGVFLYYYVSSVTNQFPKKYSKVLLHLAPTIISYICLIPFLMLTSHQKAEVFINNGIGYETYSLINSSLIYLSGIFYVVWSSLLLRKHKKNIYSQFSNIEEINLKWLQFLTYGLGVIWCIVIFTKNGEYIFTVVSFFVILIGFFGVQQKNIFKDDLVLKQTKENSLERKSKKEKYATSGLTNELAEDLYKNLIQQITVEALYKENNLNLFGLASELKIHPNYLSQIINEKEGKNFHDFINTFRVEEFKKLVKTPENKQYTLLALAYDCGFNSKSSFNRHFKKNTGVTPSQYIKSVQS